MLAVVVGGLLGGKKCLCLLLGILLSKLWDVHTKFYFFLIAIFGPRRFGDTTSYRLFLYNLYKSTEAMKRIGKIKLGKFKKRGDKRWCHQTDEVPIFSTCS